MGERKNTSRERVERVKEAVRQAASCCQSTSKHRAGALEGHCVPFVYEGNISPARCVFWQGFDWRQRNEQGTRQGRLREDKGGDEGCDWWPDGQHQDASQRQDRQNERFHAQGGRRHQRRRKGREERNVTALAVQLRRPPLGRPFFVLVVSTRNDGWPPHRI